MRAKSEGEPSAGKHVEKVWQRDTCFGCGVNNSSGLRLHFELSESGKSFVCRCSIPKQFVGPPGHVHGGIIATILDEAMGKANKLKNVVALTREMQIEYLRPVPLESPLVVEGRNLRVRGRAHYNVAEIRNAEGQVLARSKGKFIAIDPQKMFSRHLEEERRAMVEN